MTNELIKGVANKIDKLADFKKWVPGLAGDIIEMFDGKMFEGFLLLFKSKVYDNLKDSDKADVDTLLLAFVTGDWSDVDDSLAARVNALLKAEGPEAALVNKIIAALFDYMVEKTGPTLRTSTDPGEGPQEPDPDK